MAHNLVNRYKQLLAGTPEGKFYTSDGQLLPHRNSPYVLTYDVGSPNSRFGVFLNDGYYTEVTSDVNGVATVSISLVKGFNEIKLIEQSTQRATVSYITTKDYATWLAAMAEVIETIDESTEQVLDDSHLEKVSLAMIDPVFGKTVDSKNEFGYNLEIYRDILQELRQAYRRHGATRRGLEDVVRAFTQVSPLSFPRTEGPSWKLGRDLIFPHVDPSQRTYYTTSPLTTVNSGATSGAAIEYLGEPPGLGCFGPDVGNILGTLKLYGGFSPKRLTWTGPTGEGDYVELTSGNGPIYTVYSKSYTYPLYSIWTAGGWDIIAANSYLYISLDDRPMVQIPLTTGAAVSAAQLVSDINAGLVAAYGAGYAAAASVHDPYLHGGEMFKIEPIVPGGTITLYTTTPQAYAGINKASAAQVLFNLPYVRGELSGAYPIGSTQLSLNPTILLDRFPRFASVDEPIYMIVGGDAAHMAGASTPSSYSVPELVKVINIDQFSWTLDLESPTTIAHNVSNLVTLDGLSRWERKGRKDMAPIYVSATNPDFLTSSTVSDLVIVRGTGVPDTWQKDPPTFINSPAPLFEYFSRERDLPFQVGSGSTLSIPINKEILDYKGFPIDFYFWWSPEHDRPQPWPYIDTLVIEWSDTLTVPYDLTATSLNQEQCPADPQPSMAYGRVIVPEGATKCIARIDTVGTGNVQFHKVRVVPVHQFGLFLGHNTIPRGEQQIKSGEFMYVWSPEMLTDVESKKIGVFDSYQNFGSHIDMILPDFVPVDRFDVSEYTGLVPKNTRGVFTDTEFTSGTSTNLELVVRNPARFSHLIPNRASEVVDTPLFSTTPAYTWTLTEPSTQDLSRSVLLENGVPVTQDQWQYNSATQIELLYPPVTTATYEFRYDALIRFESNVIDLLATYTNYSWWADWHIFQRDEVEPVEVTVTTGVQFDGNGQAVLSERAVTDKTRATLKMDLGLNNIITIPFTSWDFVNNTTITIDIALFNPDAVYELTYAALVVEPRPTTNIVVELKDAASIPALSSAVYRTVSRNSLVSVGRYCKMRVSITGVKDTRDVRVMSLCLKGLPLFGGGSLPVLSP